MPIQLFAWVCLWLKLFISLCWSFSSASSYVHIYIQVHIIQWQKVSLGKICPRPRGRVPCSAWVFIRTFNVTNIRVLESPYMYVSVRVCCGEAKLGLLFWGGLGGAEAEISWDCSWVRGDLVHGPLSLSCILEPRALFLSILSVLIVVLVKDFVVLQMTAGRLFRHLPLVLL